MIDVLNDKRAEICSRLWIREAQQNDKEHAALAKAYCDQAGITV